MARPFKKSPAASHDWEARATQALADAQKMPEGPERAEVLRKIELLRAGADMRRALSGSQGRSQG